MTGKMKQMFERHDTKTNAIVVLLRDTEKLIVRMIHGIPMLFVEWFPELFRKVFDWLNETVFLWAHIAISALRLAGVFLIWATLVFGPLGFCPWFLSCMWLALAIAGSVWGIHRKVKGMRSKVVVTT